MKTLISWIVIAAILISTFPRAAFATEPPPWFEGPDPDDSGPSALLANPLMDAIQETRVPNKLGIVSAVVPFTDETGRLFDFKIDFSTRAYQIVSASGQVVGGGTANPNHATALEAAFRDYRSAKLAQGEATTESQQRKWIQVAALVVAVIALIIAYLAWQGDNTNANAGAQQFERLCASQAANATAANFANTAAGCPMNVTRRGAQICTTYPVQVTEAFQCTGATYRCETRCE